MGTKIKHVSGSRPDIARTPPSEDDPPLEYISQGRSTSLPSSRPTQHPEIRTRFRMYTNASESSPFRCDWHWSQLESDEVRNQLFTASTMFKYHPLSSESAVSTFLRGCAIQDFLSRKTISLIRRKYFVAPTAAGRHKSGMQPEDWILDQISNVPAVNSSQQLSWRLTTVEKLDRLGSCSSSATATVATEPDQGAIVKEMWNQLHHFQSPSDEQLDAILSDIASIAIWLWSALRKDSCQVDFDYDPSAGDQQEWGFVDDVVTSSAKAANSRGKMPVVGLVRRDSAIIIAFIPKLIAKIGS